MWRNQPCVVLGRNQNPWLECNIPYIKEKSIILTRRQSGGGTVYHDLGNLNVTILTSKHEPEVNTKFACDTLSKYFNLDVRMGTRKDIFIGENKISGSAFRITSNASYHHFTFLISTDMQNLENSLISTYKKIDTKATSSIRSKVLNINDFIKVKPEIIQDFLIENFTKTFSPNHLFENKKIENWDQEMMEKNIKIQEIHNEIENWDHVFGKTPFFIFEINSNFKFGLTGLKISVLEGRISNLEINKSKKIDIELENRIKSAMIGVPFESTKIIENLELEICLVLDITRKKQLEEILNWIKKEI